MPLEPDSEEDEAGPLNDGRSPTDWLLWVKDRKPGDRAPPSHGYQAVPDISDEIILSVLKLVIERLEHLEGEVNRLSSCIDHIASGEQGLP